MSLICTGGHLGGLSVNVTKHDIDSLIFILYLVNHSNEIAVENLQSNNL